MATSRLLKIGAAALGAVALAGTVVIVTASANGYNVLPFAASPSPSARADEHKAQAQAACDSFVGHLAKNLGKSNDQVKKALKDSFNQSLDDAVKNGQLTKEQADAIKARAGDKDVCAGGLVGIGVHKPGPGDHGPGAGRPGFGGFVLDDTAKALGITTDELKKELAAGKTVKDIAASKGMDENAFRTKLIAAVKADLDQQVTAGKITQQQEDAILNRLKSGPLPLWDRPMKRPDAKPSASTT